MAVELSDGGIELCALLAFDQELGDLLASFEILRAHLPHLPLLSGPFPLRVQGTERVLRELALVLLECDLSSRMPGLTLLRREVLPGESNNLRERTVVCLDVRRHVLALDEVRAEKDERIGWPRNVIFGLLLRVATAGTRWGQDVTRGREEHASRGWILW